MAFRRACFCCELGETVRLRSFMPWAVFRFSCHGMNVAGAGLPCRGDGVGGSSCLPLSVRSSPCPLGRGIMCGLRASAPPAVRGSGVSSRFSYLIARRRVILPAIVVIVSPCLLRHPVFVPSSSHPPPSPLPFPPAPPSSSSLVFSCGFLSLLSPFLRLAGRGDICLLASSVFGSRSLVSCPRDCLPSVDRS